MDEGGSLSQAQGLTPEQLQEMLKPIRELSAAWDVPLVDYLDHYLSEIGGQEIRTIEDIPNFSQAGLFLQGSTNVFSKKVKFLYDVAMNSTTSELEDGHEGKTRKRRLVDWVADDVLVQIDDPEETDTLMKPEDDQPRIDVTTLPRVPFCLLNSLEASAGSGSSLDRGNFRLSIVPDEKHSVILVDPAVTFSGTGQGNIDMDHVPLSDASEKEEAKYDEEVPDVNDEENVEENADNDNCYDGQIQEESDRPEDLGLKMLDPDDTSLGFATRPFRKMDLKCFSVPVGFEAQHFEKVVSKKPFHENIFAEIFAKVKSLREKLMREEDRGVILTIPAEAGREHVLEDIDVYAEMPAIPDDDFDVDVPPSPGGVLSPDAQRARVRGMPAKEAYNFMCQQLIQIMIETGQTKVTRSANSEMLSLWERRLGPALERELSRKPFNVSELREMIIGRLLAQDDSMTFRSLCSDSPPHEVARIFLCILMMANLNEVEIQNESECTIAGDFVIIRKK